jgi:hypothetical protein
MGNGNRPVEPDAAQGDDDLKMTRNRSAPERFGKPAL